MIPQEILSGLCTAIEKNDFKTASTFLADDFVFSGPMPQPADKTEFLNVHASIVAGFPDWKFNLHDVREVAPNKLEGNVRVGGTNTGVLNFTAIGLSKIEPTGKTFVNIVEHSQATFEDGKLKRWDITPSPNGGMTEMFRQLGIEMPKH